MLFRSEIIRRGIYHGNRLTDGCFRVGGADVRQSQGDKSEKEQDRRMNKEHTALLLSELRDIVGKIKEQGKYEKTTINLSEVTDLLNDIKNKEIPYIPETDLTKVEGLLEKISKKEPADMSGVDEMRTTLEDIYDVLLKAWLPSENAIQVIVKNQVQPSGGGGGILPFKDSAGAAQRALVDENGQLVTAVGGSLVTEVFDSIYATYPNTSTEVYTYKLSGASVAVVTVIYTNAVKDVIVSVIKT